MPTIASVTTTVSTSELRLASGRTGRLIRAKPYPPSFSRTPARMTEPAVGASTCASGSHVWNGNIGTLKAKPAKNPAKSQICTVNGIRAAPVTSLAPPIA